MTQMPVGVNEGFVVARFLLITADGPDPERRSDAMAPAGMTVRFTPKDKHIRLQEPEDVVLTKQEITATVNSNGYLADSSGQYGIYLPTGWWTVTYESTLAGLAMHDIEVTTDHTEAAPLRLISYQPPPTPVTQTQYTYLLSLIQNIDAGTVGEPGSEVPLHTHTWVAIADKPASYPPSLHGHIWDDISGRPTTYTPSAHVHAIADVTGLQDALNAAGVGEGGSADWNTLLNKPSNFPPSPHSHGASELTGVVKTVNGTGPDAAGNVVVEGGSSGPADWNTLLNKPAAFPPSTHTHAQSEVTGLTSALSTLTTNVNGKVTGTGITEIRALTQAAYDAITVKDPAVLYVVQG